MQWEGYAGAHELFPGAAGDLNEDFCPAVFEVLCFLGHVGGFPVRPGISAGGIRTPGVKLPLDVGRGMLQHII